MTGGFQHLKRSGKIKSVEAIVKGDEDIDGLNFFTRASYCTHLE